MAPGECDRLAPDEHTFTNAATMDEVKTPFVTAEDIEICKDAARLNRVLMKLHVQYADASAFQMNRLLARIPGIDSEPTIDAEKAGIPCRSCGLAASYLLISSTGKPGASQFWGDRGDGFVLDR